MARLAATAIRAARAGRGRWVALSLLVLLCLPLALQHHVPSLQQVLPLERLRLAWLDFYQLTLPRERASDHVVIVEIDESSLRKLGQWPWPRTLLAELIRRIGASGAAAIGLDIVMPEPDQTSPEALVPHLPFVHADVIAALSALPSNDARLAETMRKWPVVLGVAGVDTPTLDNAHMLIRKPVIVHGGEIEARIRRYPYKLVSLLPFQRSAAGQGIINADLERGVVRRVPLVSTDGVALLPALTLELLRVAVGAPAVTVHVREGDVASVSVGDLDVPTQPDGAMWVHFSRVSSARYLPALEILSDTADSADVRSKLDGKIVLIGITGLAMVDRRVTPRGDIVPGTDVHAQILESFYERRFLQRPLWMPAAEAAALMLLGGLLVWATPVMRRHHALFLLAATLVLVIALGFCLFVWTGLLFDAATVSAMLFVIFASLIVSALAQADRDRRVSQRSLRIAREAAARVSGELEAARRIQLGILPRSESSFPRERRFQLAAAIEPARTVGGDLYDFFMLDANRLFFHIADVSGKGVPASLFMSITKVLTKSVALRSGRDGRRLLTEANTELSRDNPESLFVTAFAAILDADSGELRYWTAGHDTPYVLDGRPAWQLDRSQSGPPLCVLNDFDYAQQRVQLRAGSLLVLFTDGIPEAENPAGTQYGKDRLALCLNELSPDASAGSVLQAVHDDVTQFVAGAAASDDVALVVLRWLGPEESRTADTASAP